MFDFNIPVFPLDSAAITVTTTVWVGVAVAVFFNLRLGWTLSALVVPGYLVPLLIARPTTAFVIFGEAILTYLIARMISEIPRLKPYWSSLFGRDRFFVIIVISVIVRAVCDGWLLPFVGRLAVEQYGWNVDYRNNLQSFGLIVVALIANYFWKPGLIRGIFPLSVCIGITWMLVTGILVGFTNFNVGNFHLLYEDVSVSLLASPKAYIIVITTAWIASWFNLRYAWDFNGILIPALLGLLWHEPLKIFVSIAEAMIILSVAVMLMRSSPLRNLSFQGGNKLLFFFTICFFMRLTLSHILPMTLPGVQVSDALGLGYLLSTLIAIKAHDKSLTIRMLRGTVQVSMMGAVAGSLIGFAFFCGPRIQFAPGPVIAAAEDVVPSPGLMISDQPLAELVRKAKVLLYQKRQAESYQPPTAGELSTFRSAMTDIQTLVAEENENTKANLLNKVVAQLTTIGYQVTVVEDRYLLICEALSARGWGMYIVDTTVPDGLCLEVPAPLDEWATVESGLCLLKVFPTCGVAIAGTPRHVNINGSADVTRATSTMFSIFHQTFGDSQPVQIRALTRNVIEKLPRAVEDFSGQTRALTFETADSQLCIRGSFPKSMNLAKLKNMTGGFDVVWNESPVENTLRHGERFAELFLSRDDRRRLVGRTIIDEQASRSEPIRISHVDRTLGDWLAEIKTGLCGQGTDTYVRPSTEEMLYMDQEVLQPLIGALRIMRASDSFATRSPATDFSESELNGYRDRNERVADHLRAINAAARAVDYQLTTVSDPSSGDHYIALSESNPQHPKGWGTFVFRPGLVEDFAVEIPRPLFEYRSFEFGVNLFQRPRGCALLIAGAHPRANLDGAADISKTANRTNLFNLVRHVLLRQLDNRPFLVCQARAIQAPVDADIVLATDEGVSRFEDLTPLKKHLVSRLTDDNLSVEFVDGREETAGYELGILMQASTVQVSQNKEVISLWLSPSLRTKFREQDSANNLSAQFQACDIPTYEGGLVEYLETNDRSKRQNENSPPEEQNVKLPQRLHELLTDYVQHYDMLRLYTATQEFGDWTFTRILDDSSGQAFLAVSRSPTDTPTVMNLTGFVSNSITEVAEFDRDNVNRFVRSRSLWLEAAE